ncbi:MAG: hypothetical protein OHK005_18800 [Candidatus Methylacidiphilales bacterium]
MGTLYFAYGSNLNPDQFRERCPNSQKMENATLSGYRFIITERGYATIVPCQSSTIYGVVYVLTPEDEFFLDRCEGVDQACYEKKYFQVTLASGHTVEALVYVDPVQKEHLPRRGYLEKVLAGARHHQFPESVIQELERWKLS